MDLHNPPFRIILIGSPFSGKRTLASHLRVACAKTSERIIQYYQKNQGFSTSLPSYKPMNQPIDDDEVINDRNLLNIESLLKRYSKVISEISSPVARGIGLWYSFLDVPFLLPSSSKKNNKYVNELSSSLNRADLLCEIRFRTVEWVCCDSTSLLPFALFPNRSDPIFSSSKKTFLENSLFPDFFSGLSGAERSNFNKSISDAEYDFINYLRHLLVIFVVDPSNMDSCSVDKLIEQWKDAVLDAFFKECLRVTKTPITEVSSLPPPFKDFGTEKNELSDAERLWYQCIQLQLKFFSFLHDSIYSTLDGEITTIPFNFLNSDKYPSPIFNFASLANMDYANKLSFSFDFPVPAFIWATHRDTYEKVFSPYSCISNSASSEANTKWCDVSSMKSTTSIQWTPTDAFAQILDLVKPFDPKFLLINELRKYAIALHGSMLYTGLEDLNEFRSSQPKNTVALHENHSNFFLNLSDNSKGFINQLMLSVLNSDILPGINAFFSSKSDCIEKFTYVSYYMLQILLFSENLAGNFDNFQENLASCSFLGLSLISFSLPSIVTSLYVELAVKTSKICLKMINDFNVDSKLYPEIVEKDKSDNFTSTHSLSNSVKESHDQEEAQSSLNALYVLFFESVKEAFNKEYQDTFWSFLPIGFDMTYLLHPLVRNNVSLPISKWWRKNLIDFSSFTDSNISAERVTKDVLKEICYSSNLTVDERKFLRDLFIQKIHISIINENQHSSERMIWDEII